MTLRIENNLSRSALPIQDAQPAPSQVKDAAMQTPRQQFRASSPAVAGPRTEALPPAHHHPTGDTHPHLLYTVLYIGEQRSTP